jgi:hypothetical protein
MAAVANGGQPVPGALNSKARRQAKRAADRLAAQQLAAAALAHPVIVGVGNQVGAQPVAPINNVQPAIVNPALQQPVAPVNPAPGLLNRAKGWLASSPVNTKPILHNYDVPKLRDEDTNLNVNCICALERVNERRAPHLWRLKDILTHDLPESLQAGASDLKQHFLMTLKLQKLSQTYIDNYLEKPHDAVPANEKKDQSKRFSEAVEQFKKLNDTQKDVLDLLHHSLAIPLEELRLKKTDKAKEPSLAWTFCKEHPWFSAGFALSYTAMIAPVLLNIVGEDYRFIKYGVPLAFVGTTLCCNKKVFSEAAKVAIKTLKSLGSEYFSASLIIAPPLTLGAYAFGEYLSSLLVNPQVWTSDKLFDAPAKLSAYLISGSFLAKTVFYSHTAMFAGHLIYSNFTDIVDEALDLTKKGSYKTLEVVKGYFRNGQFTGIVPAITVGIMSSSWRWGAAVYGLHAAGFGLMKVADQPESAY